MAEDLGTPEQLGDVATKLLFENDRVRVWEMVLEPGQRSDWHRHDHPYLLCIVEGDTIDARMASGRDLSIPAGPGTVYYVPAGATEVAVNRSGTRFREVLIELKDGPFSSEGKVEVATVSS
ncbi:MAG: cupin [Actinobacteria bacterium]|nr:cupin [Actinomycetota bacterium]